MRLRLAVLDMVGTTVEAGDEVPWSFREAFRGAGIELSPVEIMQIRGRSKREAISDLLGRHRPGSSGEETVETIYRRFQEILRIAYRARAKAAAGAEEAIRFLRQAQVDVVLVTGLDRETTDLLLRVLGWDGLGVSGTVTADEVEHGRPAPDLIHVAMDLTGVEDARSVMVVGDTAADLEAAAAAKVAWSVGVLSGAHSREALESRPHSALLESIRALPGWLEETGIVGAE